MSKPAIIPIALADSESTLPYLSLGMVTGYLRSYCDGLLERHYHIHKIRPAGLAGFELEDLWPALDGLGPALCLLSSYVWNHALNIRVAREIRARAPQALVIIGGPEVPKYPGETEAFLRENPFIDIAVLGEGEVSCAEIARRLASGDFAPDSLEQVAGIVYRGSAGIVRTAERDRARDINQFPSPYLTGEFEPWLRAFGNTILETNRGCPYGCTYCDWGSATLQKVNRFEPSRVVAEIEYLAERESQAIFIADANFGMLEQGYRDRRSPGRGPASQRLSAPGVYQFRKKRRPAVDGRDQDPARGRIAAHRYRRAADDRRGGVENDSQGQHQDRVL